MNHCGNCANYDRQREKHTDVCATCITAYVNGERQEPSHWRCIPMTNADRIRAMTDEELAVITMCPYNFGAEIDCYHAGSCVECTTKWLKQPAEDL